MIIDDSTLGGQIELMQNGGGYEPPPAEPTHYAPPQQEEVVTPNTLAAQIAAMQSGEEIETGFDGGDAVQPAQDQDDAPADAFSFDSLPDDIKELVAQAQSPLGKRFLADAQKLAEEYGSAEKVLAALDAPVIDEQAIWNEAWGGPVAAVLNTKDEYGDPKYSPDDPLIQAMVSERFERMRDKVLYTQQTQQSVTPAQQREAAIESAADTLLKMYPNADPETVKAAIASGGDGSVAAKRSHAHVTNLLTRQGVAQAKANPDPRASAPKPLVPGRAGSPSRSSAIPDPFKDPAGFKRYEQSLLSQYRK
jgi:hypothetical protein